MSRPVLTAGRSAWLCFTLLTLLTLIAASPAVSQLFPPQDPVGNPTTPSKVSLGKVLFWDEQLSSTRTVACGPCHIPRDGGGDPRSAADPDAIHPGLDGIFGGLDDILGSPGVPASRADGTYILNPSFGLAPQVTGRRTTSSINAGYSPSLFWDGRAGGEFVDPVTDQVVLASGAALESQALGPLVSDIEMAHVGRTWPEVLARVTASEPLALATRAPQNLVDWIDGRTYEQLFAEAFGSAGITAPRIGMAIAAYERTQFTNQSPFDTFLSTGSGLTPQEQQGRSVFVASSCDRCHSLEITTDHDFHFTGVRPQADDPGRFEVTADEDDRGKMRTPSLRNVELRPPYMRNGRFATLEDVVDFYDRGGDFDAPNKDPLVRQLNLTPTERAALLAFLKRPLTDVRLRDGMAPFDRPRLYSESDRVPQVSGTGVATAEGPVPRVVAVEPALLGNPSFTVGLFDAGAGGTQATLAIDLQDPGLSLPASAAFAFETVALEVAESGDRFASISLAIANDDLWLGRPLFGRWYIPGAGAGAGTAVSDLVSFQVFSSLQNGALFLDGFETGDLSRWSLVSP